MPNLRDRANSSLVKILFIGTSGAGKTGALTSLAAAGYRIRILDLDNGLDALAHHLAHEHPNAVDKVDFETVRDSMKATPAGPQVKGSARAFVEATKLMDKWSDDTVPAEWGQDTIFVLDSLTAFGRAAFLWAKGQNPGAREPRQWYKVAQDAVEDVLAMLTSAEFQSNVIVISHVDIREQADGSIRGFASSIGAALGPKIPRYFNTLVLSETSGTGKNVKRKIKTVPTSLLDLKNPKPMKIEAELPLETGLGTIFKQLSSA